jgi:hypothetical protein
VASVASEFTRLRGLLPENRHPFLAPRPPSGAISANYQVISDASGGDPAPPTPLPGARFLLYPPG